MGMQVRMRHTYCGREKFVQKCGAGGEAWEFSMHIRNRSHAQLGSFCCQVNWSGYEEKPPEGPMSGEEFWKRTLRRADRLVGLG